MIPATQGKKKEEVATSQSAHWSLSIEKITGFQERTLVYHELYTCSSLITTGDDFSAQEPELGQVIARVTQVDFRGQVWDHM